ncbi:MAG: NAD(P)/FAD-dependent oxidoreductase [Methanosarcinales archaeon]|nr:NAD(P)/FAD-dependent oxidoreductase [Methanosarcinales archaeon]
MKYDLIVVGAGPAGSITAKTVAQAGYDVLVLERDAFCRSPCAGYVSSTINIELPETSSIQSQISRMRTYFPDMSFHDFPINGFVADRPAFDMMLVSIAESAGAQVEWKSPLLDLTPDGVSFRGGEASATIIVGADGVFSKTASLMGLDKQKVAVCAQYHLKGVDPLPGTSEIFFNADYAPGGYVWIYPTGKDSARVGLGITEVGSRSPHQYLDAFIDESPLVLRMNGQKTEYVTGALPIGGLRDRLCFDNILLVGDSAGMADPVTGAGINSAILASEAAGNTIIAALEKNDLTLLAQYETKVKRLLARTLGRSLGKRRNLDKYGTSNEFLQQNLPEMWVTFKEYWQ